MTSFAGDANSYVGDPDLKPEVAHNLAATLKFASADGRRGLTVSAYRSQVGEFIDAVKLADLANGFVRLRFANVDARLHGFDASGHAQVWESPTFGRGSLTGTLSWVEGENRDSGDTLYHMTPLTLRLGLEQAKGRWTHHAEVELVGEKDAVNALLNLRSGWKGERVRVNLAAVNLFDTAHDLPLGGVSFGASKAGGSVPPIRPLRGPGRSINLSLPTHSEHGATAHRSRVGDGDRRFDRHPRRGSLGADLPQAGGGACAATGHERSTRGDAAAI